MYQAAYRKQHIVLGKHHQDTLSSMLGLANVCKARGHLETAHELLRNAVQVRSPKPFHRLTMVSKEPMVVFATTARRVPWGWCARACLTSPSLGLPVTRHTRPPMLLREECIWPTS